MYLTNWFPVSWIVGVDFAQGKISQISGKAVSTFQNRVRSAIWHEIITFIQSKEHLYASSIKAKVSWNATFRICIYWIILVYRLNKCRTPDMRKDYGFSILLSSTETIKFIRTDSCFSPCSKKITWCALNCGKCNVAQWLSKFTAGHDKKVYKASQESNIFGILLKTLYDNSNRTKDWWDTRENSKYYEGVWSRKVLISVSRVRWKEDHHV